MTKKTSILAGTALGLVMAASPLVAAPLSPAGTINAARISGQPLILAQAEATDEEELRRQQEQAEEEAPAEEPAAEQPAPEPEPAPAPEPEPEPEPAPEPAPEPEQAPAAEQPAEEPAAEAPAAEEPAAEEPAPTAEEPAEAAPTAEEPAAEEPAAEQPASEEQPAGEAEQPRRELPTVPTEGTEAPAEQTPAEEPAAEDAAPADEEEPAAEEPQTEMPADAAPADSEQPVEGESPEEDVPPTDGSAEVTPQPAPNSGEAAPILDSAKDAENAGEPLPEAEAVAEEDLPPPPENDSTAQAEGVVEGEIQSSIAEEGRRIEVNREDRRERREQREGSNILREIGDRVLIEFNNQIVVENYDQPRIGRDAAEVYYEELPRGRTREVVVRENGVQVVTIRDRYGDIIRRSRITPDGREYVLVYADGRDRDQDRREWRDPARELPPLRLRVPREEYILEARFVEEPDRYYEFLDSPPVEQVQRLYTVDEVRYSSRVRDIMPRIELDTLTFNFGSADIDDSQVEALEGLAEAMQRMLEENPGETFMIEGHTDAVGSDEANLALSDRRAETIAIVLTDYFDIPAENLVTQGYGERYLKIETQTEERQNRRVVARRITPLVAPVASAQ